MFHNYEVVSLGLWCFGGTLGLLFGLLGKNPWSTLVGGINLGMMVEFLLMR